MTSFETSKFDSYWHATVFQYVIIEIEKLKSNIYDLYTQNLLHLQNIMHFRFPALMTPILGRTISYYEDLVMHKNFS